MSGPGFVNTQYNAPHPDASYNNSQQSVNLNIQSEHDQNHSCNSNSHQEMSLTTAPQIERQYPPIYPFPRRLLSPGAAAAATRLNSHSSYIPFASTMSPRSESLPGHSYSILLGSYSQDHPTSPSHDKSLREMPHLGSTTIPPTPTALSPSMMSSHSLSSSHRVHGGGLGTGAGTGRLPQESVTLSDMQKYMLRPPQQVSSDSNTLPSNTASELRVLPAPELQRASSTSSNNTDLSHEMSLSMGWRGAKASNNEHYSFSPNMSQQHGHDRAQNHNFDNASHMVPTPALASISNPVVPQPRSSSLPHPSAGNHEQQTRTSNQASIYARAHASLRTTVGESLSPQRPHNSSGRSSLPFLSSSAGFEVGQAYSPEDTPIPSSHLMSSFGMKKSVSGVRRHICPQCGKKFTRPSSLQTHSYSHTGEKPYICGFPGCNRPFSVISNMRRHEKLHRMQQRRPDS